MVKAARNTEAHLQRDLFLVRQIEPGFGWNPLSLGGDGRFYIDRRDQRLAQPAPPPPPTFPKPARSVLSSTPAMARKLAEHQFKPWWLR